MRTPGKTSSVAFGGYSCRFEFDHHDVEALLVFLFGDMMVNHASANDHTAHYVLRESEHEGWQVSCNDGTAEQFQSLNAMGNFLAGDVLFRLIEPNKQYLAIHAGLVSNENGSVLLPAESGSGKTSVTAWLTSRGWRYHTDELVLID